METAHALRDHPPSTAQPWIDAARHIHEALSATTAFGLLDLAFRSGALPRAAAREALLELGATPFDRAGQPFLPYTGARLALRAPHRDRFLIPSETDWRCFESGEAEPLATLDLDAEDHPAAWLDKDTIAVGAGTELELWRPSSDERHHALTLPCSIDALLRGAEGTCVASLRTSELQSDDLYICHPTPGESVFVPNVQTDLEQFATSWSSGFVCCRSGVQSSEVRFVRTTLPATWVTRFVHACTVIAVAPVDDGTHVLSLDRDGLVVFWRGDQPRPVRAAQLPASLRLAPSKSMRLAANRLDSSHVFVYDAAHNHLIHASLTEDTWTRLPGLGPLAVLGLHPEAPLLTQNASGWIWLDPLTLTLREPDRLSAALASEDELRATPVDDHVIDRLLEVRARDEAPPLTARERAELRVWIRAPQDSLLEDLASGRVPEQ